MSQLINCMSKLDITTVIGCKVACRYCPHVELVQAYKEKCKAIYSLHYDDFVKILSKMREGASLAFSGMSEPFLNRETANMMKAAYEKGFKISVNTTLVGMRDEDFETLYEGGGKVCELCFAYSG